MISNYPVEEYLAEAKIPIRLSCTTDTGWPVVLSLWYLFEDGNLYCATLEKAKVVGYLREEPRCAFEVAGDEPPYCGVRGPARATIEPERGWEILERLLERYLGGTDNELAQRLLSREAPEVAIRLEPVTYHSWNFSSRMQDSVPGAVKKICPE